MKRILPLLITLLVVLPALGTAVSVSAGNTWKEYNFISTSIVAYDFDKDGNIELLALPYYVIDNYVQVKSPYEQYEHALLVDLNLDGKKELVLYNNAGDYLVYDGAKLLKHFYLGPGKPIVDLTHEAIAVGNQVIFNMTLYTFPDAQYTSVYPVVAGNELYVLYDKGRLYLEDTNGTRWTVFADAIDPIGAVMSYNTLYVLGRTVQGNTVFIRYTLGGSAQISGFTVKLARAVMWIPFDNVFMAVGEDGDLYRVSFNALVLEMTGQFLGCDGRYIYAYNNGEIYVYSPSSQTTIAKITTPQPVKPDVFGGSYPYLGVVYGRKTYALVLKPEPVATLIIPAVVTAGDRTYYRLDTANAVEATLTVNGTRIPLEGYITFNKTGTYVFTASVSNGIITVTRTFKVIVAPRPLVISIKVLGSPIAYKKAPVVVEVTDGLNGSRVESVYCTVSVPEESLTVKPWNEVNVTLIPVSVDSLNVPLTVVCGDNKFYKETEYSINIPVQPNVARIKLDYLGNGKIKISFISAICTCTVPGEVNVFLDGNFVSHGTVPYILEGLKPGNHTITVEFTPSVASYRPAKYTVRLTYYANVSEVPSKILSTVQIADRVKVINKTVVKTRTETVTVPKPVYVEKPVIDTAKTVFLFIIGLAAGAIVGFVVRHITLKKRRGAEERQSAIEKEMEEYEVEVEKT